MRKSDVPQDAGLLDEWHELAYAVDEEGRYGTVQSAGWKAKDVVNRLAWEQIGEEVEAIRREVVAGRRSPLAYHMVKHQMSARDLAAYAGFSAWRTRRHLKPKPFSRLGESVLERYARVFEIQVEDLRRVPEGPQPSHPKA
ncbi:helix-turn-helix transcriptional regulator [bacterium]|nr:helix-turn-helix transcriptional regulator [bacterium]